MIDELESILRKRLWSNQGNIPAFAPRDWGKLWKFQWR
jgi:hypothetical protein